LLLLLFVTLWGGLLALLLCAPYSYYPLFFIILAASIVIYLVSRKYFKVKVKFIYPIAAVLFLLSYSLCSYIIFKPADFHYVSNENLIKDKKAVIFYCEGEMEKYTPYYSSYFFKDAPFILKPVYAMSIKRVYRQIEVNTKNKELISVAQEVKNSILNYKPYYFYICFEGYVPDIKDSIHSAISDGCSEIIVLNYTANYNLEKNIGSKIDIENLKTKGIDIKFTQPVCNTDMFVELFSSKIVNMPFKWDGIIILGDENFASSKIKASLEQVGYEDSQIIINRNIPESVNYFKNREAKSILYVNIAETSSGINSDLIIPAEFEKYSGDIKITGIKSWGYDKRLVKASIKVFLEVENPSK
jgi:hypothetical protein